MQNGIHPGHLLHQSCTKSPGTSMHKKCPSGGGTDVVFFSAGNPFVSAHCATAGDISMTHKSICEAKEGATEFLGSVSCWHQGLHCNFQARKPAEVIRRAKECDIKV